MPKQYNDKRLSEVIPQIKGLIANIEYFMQLPDGEVLVSFYLEKMREALELSNLKGE